MGVGALWWLFGAGLPSSSAGAASGAGVLLFSLPSAGWLRPRPLPPAGLAAGAGGALFPPRVLRRGGGRSPRGLVVRPCGVPLSFGPGDVAQKAFRLAPAQGGGRPPLRGALPPHPPRAAAASRRRSLSCSHVRRRAGCPCPAFRRRAWFLRLWGLVGVWRLLESVAKRVGAASSRPAPPAREEKCNVVPCRLPPLRARARCARAPLCYGSLVCRGWCASSPLPPAPPSHVGGGLAVLCSRGGSPVGICSPLMPSRGVVAAAGNRRRATTCGGRPWLRGAWSVPRGLVPPPTHSSFWHLGRRRVACCLHLGLGSAPQSWVVPDLGGGVAVVLWGFIRHRESGRALFVACAPRGAWRTC